MSIGPKYSLEAFERLDTAELRDELASELQDEVERRLHAVALPIVERIVRALALRGHDLRHVHPPEPVDIELRDDRDLPDSPYECDLRLSCSVIASCGFRRALGDPQC